MFKSLTIIARNRILIFYDSIGSVRLLGIVNDFLDTENLEAGRISLNITQVDIAQLIKEIMADFTEIAGKKNISLKFTEPQDPLQPVMVDRSRMQQILVNVISNAIHYTNHGGVTVSAKTDNENISIFIEDTGIGIDAEDKKRLFKKFETGKIFLKSKEYGSGLGLYISKLLANLMGIDIKLEKSEEGHGSIFSIIVPIHRT